MEGMESAANKPAATSDGQNKVSGEQTQQASNEAPVQFDKDHGDEAEQAKRIAGEEDALTPTE
jgi:hypothetical protein